MDTFNWTCPYCNRHSTLHNDNRRKGTVEIYCPTIGKCYFSKLSIIVCPNKTCQEKTMILYIQEAIEKLLEKDGRRRHEYESTGIEWHWSLLPESSAKPFPNYIPEPLLQDYKESCLIKDKSPKASATLSRRCLQGMIRDFWGIKKSRLKDEIDALEDKVDQLSWKAIDSVRNIGNIGAHMEKDINVIVEVDEGEADLLIKLIENLFEEWYIKRHDKEQRMNKLIEAAESKKNLLEERKKENNET